MNQKNTSSNLIFLLGFAAGVFILFNTICLQAQSVPIPPSYLVATEDATFNRIRLEWRDGSDNEDGFRIERKTTGAYSLLAEVGPVPGHGDQTNYHDENLAWSTSYTYRVLAFNGAGNSTYSNEDTATTPQELVNHIVNGEFELDPVNNNGWTAQIWSGSVTFEWATDEVRGGSHSAKIVCSNSEGGYNKDLVDRIPLTAGYSYDLSIWVKLNGVTGDGAWIWTEQFNSSGGVIGGTRWDSSKLTGTRDWMKLSHKFTATSTAASMNLYIHFKGSGTVWYDDAVVAKGDPPPPPGTLVVDGYQVIEPWHRFYEGSVGSCHPITVLSSSYGRNIQGALTRGHNEAGFKRIRPHGILNSSVGVYSEPGGTPTYNWTTFDQIYDTVRSIGMYPIVELSHTPPDLATGGSTCFWYNGHAGRINPPDNYQRWRDLIREIVLHCEARYGVEEVRNQWYFEVYNEPDLPYFFDGSSEDYLRMYDWAAEGIIQADPLVRLGGPATSGGRLFGSDPNYIHPEQFIKHVTQETNFANGQIGTKCDFISYHRYSNDGGYNGGVSKPISIVSYHEGVINLMAQYGFTGEAMCTEWAPTYDSIPVHSDTESAASFIAKSIHLLNDNGDVPPPDIYSWWVISDIFEEWNAYRVNFMPAYGGEGPGGGRTGDYGLILRGDPAIPDSYDVEKTSFNAFKILHQLTDDRLSFVGGTTGNGVNGTATIASDNMSIQVMVYNHIDGGTADSTQSEQVTLRVQNIPFAPGQVKVSHVVVDRTRSNSYRVWQDMGSPLAPSASQWATLRAAAALTDHEPQQTLTLSSSTFEKTFNANVYSVHLITLESDTTITPPSNLVATAVSGSEINLSWQDNTHGDDQEDAFVIQRRPYQGQDEWHNVGTVSQDVTTYNDTDHICGMVTYHYRVGAMKSF